ncbi:MAG: glutathione S-transferase family protein [Burkholderiaceae bacterium]
MALTIWGRPEAVNVQKVLWCAEELGLDYTRIDAGGRFGGLDTPEFLGMNPWGRVPVIRHNDFTLWESNACLRYLCRTFKQGPFADMSDHAFAQADQWVDWLATTLYYPALRQYYLYQTKIPAAEKDPAKLAAFREEALIPLRFLNDQLGQRDFVASGQFSMADLLAGVYVDRWMRLDAEAQSLTHIARYFETLSQREPYKKTILAFEVKPA